MTNTIISENGELSRNPALLHECTLHETICGRLDSIWPTQQMRKQWASQLLCHCDWLGTTSHEGRIAKLNLLQESYR